MSSIRRTILRGMDRTPVTRVNEAGNRTSRRKKQKKTARNA